MYVGQLVSKMPVSKIKAGDDSLVDSDTLLGVEIEVEGCKKTLPPSNNASNYWRKETDDSLRNNGAEFVFAEPLYGADVVKAITHFCEVARANSYVISERTGLHVHMDVRSMELEQFRNFCVLYALLEKPLYRWIGDRRDQNIHCLSWYTAEGDIKAIGQIFKIPAQAASVIHTLNRYAGLNLQALEKFGTVEFRHMKTTFDSERIINWINIILCLRKAACAWQDKTEKLISEFRILGPFTFMHRIFGSRLTGMLWYPEFVAEARGYAAPMAAHIFEASAAISRREAKKKSPGNIFIQTVRNIKDQQGDPPGILKLKKRREDQMTAAGAKDPISRAKFIFAKYNIAVSNSAIKVVADGGQWHATLPATGTECIVTLNGIQES